MSRDDERLGRAARALRLNQGLRQRDLVVPGRSREFTLRLEAGQLDRLRVGDVRDHFAGLGAAVRINAWWNGASLDRLLDERHAAVVEAMIRWLGHYGWRAETEVTFSEWGERGSIDVFGVHDATRSVVVGEAKSEWGSLEETIRVLDVKHRLAPVVAKRRFGWAAQQVASLLVFPEGGSARRVAQRHAATLGTAFPARNVEVRRWLRRPNGALRGLWFLSDVDLGGPGAARRP